MKRNERTTLNQLKKTVNENTIRVEVPADFSIEARQAIHELLTIEKHMIAVGYYWDPITDTERVNYIKAWEGSEGAQRERMNQEVTPIEEVEEDLPHHDYAWTGHRKPAKEEEHPSAEITQEDLDEAVSETISQAARKSRTRPGSSAVVSAAPALAGVSGAGKPCGAM
ncbi:MAG: hypothetical protein IIV27_01575 [Clostridia bacterium]|nr:hypothetical protein [Clostridia bacterium]